MIDVSRNGRVLHLALNAPPVNVLDAAVLTALARELESGIDDGVAAVFLSGSGRCFSAGASVAEHRAEQADRMIGGLLDACEALANSPAPTVALVHGACLGGAMELVAFCDFVVADPGARFGQPEIKLAFFPPVACVQLARVAGLQNAAYSILTGDDLDAETALQMGVAQKLLAQSRWSELDETFNSLSAAALRVTKRALTVGAGPARGDRLEALRELFLGELYQLDDVAEGIASFEERRSPEWKHR